MAVIQKSISALRFARYLSYLINAMEKKHECYINYLSQHMSEAMMLNKKIMK